MKKHVIIGTAGHIDHGKTTLIQALTGRNTDRLKEEKERGITIDLGFTWFDLPDGERAGIIDVPGHEKFISNMTAGVVGMDLVLLVIAADEGVMPQTQEHLEILKLLGVKKILVVLNKCDLVEEEWIQMVEQQIREEFQRQDFLNGNCREKKTDTLEILRVSAKTGAGIPKLKERITQWIKTDASEWKTSSFARLPVDRVFTVKGAGTVVTGTLLGGQIRAGERLMIYPQQIPCRVREVQVYEEATACCEAGQRSALNLVKADRRQQSDGKFVSRGNVVALEGSMKVSRYLNVRLFLLPNTKRKIEHQTRLHFYSGTTEVLCRAVPLSCETIEPGTSAYVQLRMEQDVALCPGDPFLVRFYSPLETIGGGVILEIGEQKERRFHERCLQRLEELERNPEKEKQNQEQEEQHLSDQLALEKKIMDELQKWLSEHPYRTGMPKTVLLNQIGRGKKEWNQILQNCLQMLEAHGIICCTKQEQGKKKMESICPVNYQVKETEHLQSVREALEKQSEEQEIFFVNKDGLEACLETEKKKKLVKKTEKQDELQEILNYLMEQQELIEVGNECYTTMDNAIKIQEKITSMLLVNQTITMSQAKEAFQTSRKNVRLIFAYTDRIGLTTKQGAETERTAGEELEE